MEEKGKKRVRGFEKVEEGIGYVKVGKKAGMEWNFKQMLGKELDWRKNMAGSGGFGKRGEYHTPLKVRYGLWC